MTCPVCGEPYDAHDREDLILCLDAVAEDVFGCEAMELEPARPTDTVFSRGLGRHVVWVGLLMAAISLSVGLAYWRGGNAAWQTILFTTLTLSQMAHILAIRTERVSLFTAGLFSNTPLLVAVLLTTLLQLIIVQLPILQATFRTTSLSLWDWVLSLILSSLVFWAVEFEKLWFRRTRGPRRAPPSRAR